MRTAGKATTYALLKSWWYKKRVLKPPLSHLEGLKIEMQSMRTFDAASRVKRYFSVRYRTEIESAAWNFNEQRDSLAANTAQLTEPIPYTFAQFPAGKSWLTIS